MFKRQAYALVPFAKKTTILLVVKYINSNESRDTRLVAIIDVTVKMYAFVDLETKAWYICY